jgi:hypothetical protein
VNIPEVRADNKDALGKGEKKGGRWACEEESDSNVKDPGLHIETRKASKLQSEYVRAYVQTTVN